MASTVDQAEFVFAKASAQRNATLIQLGAVLGAVVCITLAALLQNPINEQRKKLQLVLQSDIYKELPPKYAWVSAAGGTFRGVAADILWARAEGLKEEGKYYELHQLAKWICTLQPRFATVWSFQAWNMSYNISVATHSTRERWQWVYNGIRLLRDEGIPNNEKIVPLYHQLAWTWFHKVGDRLDDYHMKYKRIWATTMHCLLGEPPVGASEEEQANWLKPVADAPLYLEALIAQRPGVAKLAKDLKAIDIDVDAGTSAANQFHPLEPAFFKPYTAYLFEKKFASFRKSPMPQDEQTKKLFALLDSANADDLQVLICYLRAKVLREQYKMDPKYMQELTGQLGTEKPIFIDWRTPWSQAIYWGKYGTDKGRQLKTVQQFDLLNTDRILVYSLGQLARQGRYIFRPLLDTPEESFLTASPDFRYVEAMHQMCLRMGKLHAEPGEKVGNTAGEGFRDFHINTLQSVLLGLYFSGHQEEARKYYEYLAINYPDQYTGKTKDMYYNFRDFVQKQISDMAGSQHEAIMLIHSLLANAYMALANGQYNEYAARTRNAHDLYESYQADKETDREGRRVMPPWEQVLADGLDLFITDPQLPLALRFVVWERVDAAIGNVTEIKQRCYDDLRAKLEEMYGKTDLDIDKAFPAPPDMEAWRQSHPVVLPEQVAKEAQDQKLQRERAEQNK